MSAVICRRRLLAAFSPSIHSSKDLCASPALCALDRLLRLLVTVGRRNDGRFELTDAAECLREGLEDSALASTVFATEEWLYPSIASAWMGTTTPLSRRWCSQE